MTQRDVVIIGAGLLGGCAGWELLKRGWRVTVVEREGEVGQGSTAASLGIVRFHASTRSAVALAYEGYFSWLHWREWLELPPRVTSPRLIRCGGLILDCGDGYVEHVMGHLNAVGVPHERLGRRGVRERYPYLDLRRFGEDPERPRGWLDGGLLTPDTGYVDDPSLAVANLFGAIRRAGGALRLGCAVREVAPGTDGRPVVGLVDGGELRGSAVLLAAGPQSRQLLAASHALDDFTVAPAPLRHDMFHVNVPAPLTAGAPLTHLVDRDLCLNFRPEGRDGLLGGGTQPPGTVGDPKLDGRPAVGAPSAERHHEVVARLARRIPGLTIPRRPRGLAGFFDVTEDWKPIYDRTSVPGLYVAAGTSGTQLKTAPVVGRMLAALIDADAESGGRGAEPGATAGRYVAGSFSLPEFSRSRAPADLAAATIEG